MTATAQIESHVEQPKEEQILLPGQTPQGEYILSLLVKRTYEIIPGASCRRLTRAARLIKGDKHYGDPRITPVKFEADLVPFKLATDIVLNAKAYAPEAQAIPRMRCGVKVGQVRKQLVITGDRACEYRGGTPPNFLEPEFFTEMALTYDRAYGGVDIRSDPHLSYPYPRNLLGKGFVVKNTKQTVDKLPLPNIEDPAELLTPENIICGEYPKWQLQPQPQGLGWYSKYWYPRAPLAGVMPADRAFEQDMRKLYASLLPAGPQRETYEQTSLPDIDFRFFNGASPGLVGPYLAGNEDVELEGLMPEGRLAFQLACERPRIAINIGTGISEPEVVLHTLMIRTEDRQLDAVWRGAISYPGPDWLPNLRKLRIEVQ